jgi:hypothetical protein
MISTRVGAALLSPDGLFPAVPSQPGGSSMDHWITPRPVLLI